jgi:hypothetical protein
VDRIYIEDLIRYYLLVLAKACEMCEKRREQQTANQYQEHLCMGQRMLARWRGGLSIDDLKAELNVERTFYESPGLLGRESEEVGQAFGELCHSVNVFERSQ